MESKWDADAPIPGYKTLAVRMGISDKMARRHAQNLETKGYLRRVMRTGQTHRFDLTALFDTLQKVHSAEQAKAPRPRGRPRPAAAAATIQRAP
jgi:predicted ArsR family transcriptional regulator